MFPHSCLPLAENGVVQMLSQVETDHATPVLFDEESAAPPWGGDLCRHGDSHAFLPADGAGLRWGAGEGSCPKTSPLFLEQWLVIYKHKDLFSRLLEM